MNNYGILCVVVIILFFIIILNKDTIEENWQNYVREPYKWVSTGSNPLSFYERPCYRKPYRYPYKFYKTYPLNNVSYYENL